MNDLVPASTPTDLFITDELLRRPPKTTDYLQEKCALQDLARHMVDHPNDVLSRLVGLAMEISSSSSSGISLYEADPAPGIFRWHHVHGLLAGFNGATTPRDFSPCGVCLDRAEPILCRHPEREYSWIADAHITVPEVLLVPLYVAGSHPLGTLWIVADGEGQFDSGHARVLTELAGFAGIAVHMLNTEQRLTAALEQQARLTREQEMLTMEMSHRVKNLFAIMAGMIKASARSASNPKEMALTLSGRLNALAAANALVRRTFGNADAAAHGTELAVVIRQVLLPHSNIKAAQSQERFEFDGPKIRLGEHATNGFALVFHELATNAVKYGSLGRDNGSIRVDWKVQNDCVYLTWCECGGPPVEGPPNKVGFGSTLATRTMVDQLGGVLSYNWKQRSGLIVTISVPVKYLSR
jgi:two-component sensor histidine kinase